MTTSADSTTHLIGLLLGTEDDWPRAFETLVRKLGSVRHNDADHTLNTERITIEPFDLRDPVRHDVVIDRLAWWYYHPREWLKKAALVNGTYLLNNPFTFQAMEKHSAYCAMIRLGFDIPATVLVPYKNPLDHEKWAYTAEHLQPALRPGRGRRPGRLSDVHEAVRRRSLARGQPGRQSG